MTISKRRQETIDTSRRQIALGNIAKTALPQALRQMIMRLDEMISPIPGFANHASHDEYVAERAELANLLVAERAAIAN